MLSAADALIEGYRPGVMERLGLGPDFYLKHAPSLVYGRMTGRSQSGPLADTAGHDINYIALSGALHATGPCEAPLPTLNLVGDFGGGGAMLAFGVAAALPQAARTGQGQVADAAMSDGAAFLMAPFFARLQTGGWRAERASNTLGGAAPQYGVYRCADGKFVAVGALKPQFWSMFLEQMELSTQADLPDREDPSNWPALRVILARRFAPRSRDAWCAIFGGIEACVTPVPSMSEAPCHPHNVARGTFAQVDGARIAAPVPRFGLSGNASPPAPVDDRSAVDAFLGGGGIGGDLIPELRAAGVVG